MAVWRRGTARKMQEGIRDPSVSSLWWHLNVERHTSTFLVKAQPSSRPSLQLIFQLIWGSNPKWLCMLWSFVYSSQFFFFFLIRLVCSPLLLLSRLSRVRLCATPQTAAHQAPPSLGFSRQEHWSGLPFPSPMHESEKWKWSCSVVSDSQRPHGLQRTRLLCPWNSPGKSTGVGCHCPLLVHSLEEGKCQAPRRDNYWRY